MPDSKNKLYHKGTILIVDDNQYVRESLLESLGHMGADVLAACDGVEALNIVKSGLIDTIITDVQMPRMNGLELLAAVRALYDQTPVVVITAYPDHDKIKEAIRLDVTDFIEKPFRMQQILEVTQRALAFGCALRKQNEELTRAFSFAAELPEDAQRQLLVKKITAGMRLSYQYYARP